MRRLWDHQKQNGRFAPHPVTPKRNNGIPMTQHPRSLLVAVATVFPGVTIVRIVVVQMRHTKLSFRVQPQVAQGFSRIGIDDYSARLGGPHFRSSFGDRAGAFDPSAIPKKSIPRPVPDEASVPR